MSPRSVPVGSGEVRDPQRVHAPAHVRGRGQGADAADRRWRQRDVGDALHPGRNEGAPLDHARRRRRRLHARSTTLSGSIRVVAPKRTTETVADLGLTMIGKFNSPTFVVSPPGDASRLLVVQQNGLVSLVKDGVVQPNPVPRPAQRRLGEGEKGPPLDRIRARLRDERPRLRVLQQPGREHQGGRVPPLGPDPDSIDRTQRRMLISLDQADRRPQRGDDAVRPDGYLYIAVGDGGADPPRVPVGITGQTLTDLFGSILRIDPTTRQRPMRSQPTNPFVATAGARPEIVAYGLRNPWRFWIDPKLDTMMIGDVGEGRARRSTSCRSRSSGANFGWPCKEGTTVPDKVTLPASCKTATLTPPVWRVPARRDALLDHGRRRRARPQATRARRPVPLVGPLRRQDLRARPGRASRRGVAQRLRRGADELRDRCEQPHLRRIRSGPVYRIDPDEEA